jgi:hypothetical protein
MKIVVHVHNGIVFSYEEKETLLFAAKWIEVENITLSEIG